MEGLEGGGGKVRTIPCRRKERLRDSGCAAISDDLDPSRPSQLPRPPLFPTAVAVVWATTATSWTGRYRTEGSSVTVQNTKMLGICEV